MDESRQSFRNGRGSDSSLTINLHMRNNQCAARHRKRLLHSVFPFVLLLTCITAFSQQRLVSGRVNGINNEPLSGASVVIKGTSTGTTTNSNGMFTIQA